MNLIPLSFILSGLLALPAVAAGLSPAPTLVRLDQSLALELARKAQGQLAPEEVAEFGMRFRKDLAAAKADSPPTTENSDLYARILMRLRELDPAVSGEQPTIVRSDTRSAVSRGHFEKVTTPAVIAAEKRVLTSEPFSGNRDTQDAVVPAGGRRFRFAARYAAVSLLANLPTPPAPMNDNPASTPAQAASLAALTALGAAGAMLLFGGWGGGALERRQPGIKTRMGMAAALGGALATAGVFIVPASPLISQPEVVNEVPDVVARVIPINPGIRLSGLIGTPGRVSTFVTAAEDIASTPAAKLAQRLGIEEAPEYAIIRFRTPPSISSPIRYAENPLFIGRGLTSGGAREFQVPNSPIPPDAIMEFVKAKK